jgi:hypothetical protein
LSRFTKGEKTTVTYLRNGETKTAEITF